jgi:hypothetical protein
MFQTLDIVRRFPQIVEWLRGGCRGVAPPCEKDGDLCLHKIL